MQTSKRDNSLLLNFANDLNKQGYFITCDIGYTDDTGRKKELFKVQNIVVHPFELENILQQYQGIRNVCVVNIFDLDTAVIERKGNL